MFIRSSDGASRFTVPDVVACPSCSDASAPQATIDFTLTAITALDGPGNYQATGSITAESDPALAQQLNAGSVGSVVTVNVSPQGLKLSFLPSTDVLTKTS